MSLNTRDIINKLVIVGHIDHGKSTLIGRLLYDTNSLPQEKINEIVEASKKLNSEIEFAFVMDHLFEERSRKITIDTSQVFFKSDIRKYIIIDVPGHKEFIKNMITGSSQADFAILVVDAAEGIKEQTKRHSFILTLMGIKQLIVAINKMDLINYDESLFKKHKQEIQSLLASHNLEAKCIIPISATKGENIIQKTTMPWFIGDTLLAAMDNIVLQKEKNIGKLRLPIQDTYTLEDEKIYVGRIESGELKTSHKYLIMPEANELKLEKILKFEKEKINQDIKSASQGECIGFICDKILKRGNIIIESDEEVVSNIIETKIFWMSKEKSCKKNDTFIFKTTTQETPCKINKILHKLDLVKMEKIEDSDEINLSDLALVELEFENPIMLDKFTKHPNTGRFVLTKDDLNVAGGIIN